MTVKKSETMSGQRSAIWYPLGLDVFLNRWFPRYEDARGVLDREGGYLFPYKHHFFVCTSDALRVMGLDPDDPDWERIKWDYARPFNKEAYDRLFQKRVDAINRGLT